MYWGARISLPKLQIFGKQVGKLAWYVLKKDRGIVEKQLSQIFPEIPETTRQEWAKNCFIHFGQLMMEIFAQTRLMEEHEKYIFVENGEILAQAIAQKRGVILLGIHMGNWKSSYHIVYKKVILAN